MSIGNVVSYGSAAYNFFYTLMHSCFDPPGSFLQDLYGFKLSSLLRGDSTKIIVNKNKFKFLDENSDIILQVINFMTRSSNIDASDMQYDSNEIFEPLNTRALNAAGLSQKMREDYETF